MKTYILKTKVTQRVTSHKKLTEKKVIEILEILGLGTEINKDKLRELEEKLEAHAKEELEEIEVEEGTEVETGEIEINIEGIE